MSEPDSDDEGPAPGDWEVSPERARAAWVETITQIRTLAGTGQYGRVRALVRETDAYVEGFDAGYDPASALDEDGLYLDAVRRAAIPVGDPPVQGVVETVRAMGARVPDVPTARDVMAHTGTLPLSSLEVAHAFGVGDPGAQPVGGVAGSPVMIAYDPPARPDQALVERLDGNLRAYAYVMGVGEEGRTMDVLGNELELEDVADRLGLSSRSTQALIAGVSENLRSTRSEGEQPSSVPAPNAGTDVAATHHPGQDQRAHGPR